MQTPYHRVDDRMRYVTGYCPQCQLGKVELHGLVMKCQNCGSTFDPDERVFTKVRNHPDGLIMRARRPTRKRGRPGKYGQDVVERVAEHYKNTGDAIWETARKFGISHATAARMIYHINGRSKQILGRPKKYSDELVKEVAIYYRCGNGTIRQTSEKFGLSYDTVRWMIRVRKDLHRIGAGRPTKYGEDMSKKVTEHYKNTNDTMRQTAKFFNISLRTVARMIKAQEK